MCIRDRFDMDGDSQLSKKELRSVRKEMQKKIYKTKKKLYKLEKLEF